MSLNEYNRSLHKVNSGENKREDANMMMAPYAGWQHLLLAAPLSIALLGEVMLVAGEKDFSLNDTPPDKGFQHIHYPQSFRASLVQLSNEGYEAFLQAHTNMDQIRLYSGNVPMHLGYAVRILVGGSNQEVEKMLPTHLTKIQSVADECKKLAQEVDDKFLSVMKLICELLEACTAAQGDYGKKLEKTKAAIDVANVAKKNQEEEKKRSEEEYKKMEKEVKESQKSVKEAFESMPSGWELVGMGLVESIGTGLGAALPAAAMGFSMMAGPGGATMAVTGAASAVSNTVSKNQPNESLGSPETSLLKKVNEIRPIAMVFYDYLGEDGTKLNLNAINEGALKLQAFFEKFTKDIENMNKGGNDGQEIKVLFKEGSKLAEKLKSYAGKIAEDNSQASEMLNSEVKTFIDKFNTLHTQAQAKLNANPISSPGPLQTQALQGGNHGSSAVKSVVENARFKVEQARGLLEVAQDRYDHASDQLRETNRLLGETLKEIAGLNLDKISFEEIKEILRKGIKTLADLKEQWDKLVRLFSMISNLIKVTMSENLVTFKETVGQTSELMLGGLSMSQMQRDLIYDQAMEANKYAHVVHVISTSYVQISDKHFMPAISCLSQLIALDPEKDRKEIKEKQKHLEKQSDIAQEAILELNKKEKENFHASVDKRIKQLTGELTAALPPIKNQRAVQDAKESVNKAVQNIKKEEQSVTYSSSNLYADSFV